MNCKYIYIFLYIYSLFFPCDNVKCAIIWRNSLRKTYYDPIITPPALYRCVFIAAKIVIIPGTFRVDQKYNRPE